MRAPAYARGPAVRSFGLLDHARCYPIPFLNGPDHYDARLLSLERPTPRARTYADRFSENVCEVTLVAEAALRATSDSDSPSSLSLSWDGTTRCSISHLCGATPGVRRKARGTAPAADARDTVHLTLS
jgi:hypothetical protein